MTQGTALITGASSGIGASLAKQFAAKGHDLVLVARSGDVMEDLATDLRAEFKVNVLVIPCDLLAADAVDQIKAALAAANVEVDYLVNNAGVANFGQFIDRTIDDLHMLVKLNVDALFRLTCAFLPEFAEKKRGGILNVASVAGLVPTPGYATYGATKAFVVSFTESLAEEMRAHNVNVVALCPGLVDTPLVDKVAAQSEAAQDVPRQFLLDADKVAKQGYQALLRGDVISVAGVSYQAFTSWVRAMPRSVSRRATGLMNQIVKF